MYQDVNVQGIDRFVLSHNKVLQQLTQVTFLCAPESSKENSSVNMKIFKGLHDLQAKLPGLTMLDFFLSVTWMKFWNVFRNPHTVS